MNCQVCHIEFESNRKDAKYCSARCRKIASRVSSVTDNVTFSEPDVTDIFKFTILHKPTQKDDDDMKKAKAQVRTAKYWYDIPLAALPVMQKGWPKMPEFMNGRQYFLWWQNEFKQTEDGTPILHNPFPKYDKVEYVAAAEGSRRWGL